MTEDVKGQEPTKPVGQAPAEASAPLSAEALEAELKQARDDAARYRVELRKLQEADGKRQQAEAEKQRAAMTEAERMKADLEALRAQVQTAEQARQAAVRRSAVTAAASRAGFVDVDDALRLIAVDELELDGETVKGVDQAVADLVARKPYLVKRAGAISPTNPARSEVSTQDVFTEALYRGAGLKGTERKSS